MKYKYILAGLFISAFSKFLISQEIDPIKNIFTGAITEDKYLENPRSYLEDLNYYNVGSSFLIDRILFLDDIFLQNGITETRNIDYASFKKGYNQIRYCNEDTNLLSPIEDLERISRASNLLVGEYNFCLIDFNFISIKKEAIENGNLELGTEKLLIRENSLDNFSKHKHFSFSFLENKLFGKVIKFNFDSDFHLKNYFGNRIEYLEVDFDDGSGFQRVNMNTSKIIRYSDANKWNHFKIKVHYYNAEREERSVLYAHHTIFRQGIEQIPTPSNASEEGRLPEVESEIPYVEPFYYPERTIRTDTIWSGTSYDGPPFGTRPVLHEEENTLEVSILYNPSNNGNHLKKPFIIVDGFDPGDKRNYWKTEISDNPLPYDNDSRGLYEMLDGARSPWDESTESSGLVSQLQQRGFDIVFINFRDGAGSIKKNGERLRHFFTRVLNGSAYRNEETEEMIVVGPSMGGLITRYAISRMEYFGTTHFVKQWISFDSPHKGASIPLGIQYGINFGKGRLSAQFRPAWNALMTPAAKQLLMHHFAGDESIPVANEEHNDLQEILDEYGFPRFSQRLSISNGGESKLYESSSKILDLRPNLYNNSTNDYNKYFLLPVVKDFYLNLAERLAYEIEAVSIQAYGMKNEPVYAGIFKGERINIVERKIVKHEMGIERAIGGWIDVPYTLNYDRSNLVENDHPKHWKSIAKTKNCFIPTASAFGVAPSKANLYLSPSNYSSINDDTPGKIQTPFDDLLWMPENEEHVKLSPYTRDSVLSKWIDPKLNSLVKPIVRSNQSLHEFIEGSVAYNLKDYVIFAGNSNKITFDRRSRVNVKAGNFILFKPGTLVKNSCTLTAKIESTELEQFETRSFKTLSANNNAYLNKPSNLYEVYDYSEIEKELEPAEVSSISVAIYPNPGSSEMNILLDKVADKNAEVRVYNMTGMLMYSTSTKNTQLNIDVNSWANGVYLVEVQSNGNTETVKYTKI